MKTKRRKKKKKKKKKEKKKNENYDCFSIFKKYILLFGKINY